MPEYRRLTAEQRETRGRVLRNVSKTLTQSELNRAADRNPSQPMADTAALVKLAGGRSPVLIV
jgi:hypothetical protein